VSSSSHLEWDSRFFGFPIASIRCTDQSAAELAAELRELADRGFRLVYWFGSETGSPPNAELEKLGGVLVDRRTTFAQNLRGRAASSFEIRAKVEVFEGEAPTPALEQLALTAGALSRFRTDPGFGAAAFERLYRHWITASVSGEIADVVLVIRDGGAERGLITVKFGDGEGRVGLMAVDPTVQGTGFGADLVRAALAHSVSHGCDRSAIATQGANRAACALYERCGFVAERVERVCHFWL
jgi:dTDP-4-amino-4,6-dideoxy-D-galactose acyltransferase